MNKERIQLNNFGKQYFDILHNYRLKKKLNINPVIHLVNVSIFLVTIIYSKNNNILSNNNSDVVSNSKTTLFIY